MKTSRRGFLAVLGGMLAAPAAIKAAAIGGDLDESMEHQQGKAKVESLDEARKRGIGSVLESRAVYEDILDESGDVVRTVRIETYEVPIEEWCARQRKG